jgi:hypothetical protein
MEKPMMNCKKLSLGLVAATLLATPVMAHEVYQKPGMIGFNHPNAAAYRTRGHSVRVSPGPGYYYGNRFHPAPRVGAYATAPWDDGSYGLVERQW